MLDPLGVLVHWEIMQRLTARFLLLFALLGTLVPIALQATTAPLHACCRRMGAHHCADSLGASEEPVVRDAGCCNHDCSRAVTTSHWAHPAPPRTGAFSENVATREIDSPSSIPAAQFFSSRSCRAPPKTSIA